MEVGDDWIVKGPGTSGLVPALGRQEQDIYMGPRKLTDYDLGPSDHRVRPTTK